MTDAALAACPACAAAPAACAGRGRARPGAAAPDRALAAGDPLRRLHRRRRAHPRSPSPASPPPASTSRSSRASATVEDAPGTEARLIAALDARGYEARPLDSAALEATRTDAEGRDLLARIGVAGFASMNVMLLSIAVWSGASDTTRDLLHWVSAAIALPAVAFAALPFFRSAVARARAPAGSTWTCRSRSRS